MAASGVGSGQTSTGAVINSGDQQTIGYGGIANDATVNPGGFQYVLLGGQTNNTILNGGSQTVQAYDETHGIAIYSYPGAVGTIINAGGNQYDFNTAVNTVINDGGTQMVYGNAIGTTINSGGVQDIDVSGLVTPVTIDSTTINAGGVQLIEAGSPTNTYLMQGGSVVFQESSFASGGTTALNSSTGVLTVNDNGQTFTLNLAGNYDTTAFDLSSRDGHVQITAHPLCFCKGVKLRTPQGDRPVEELCAGDSVITAGGAVWVIRWIGQSAGIVDAETRPVIVAANAFPNGTPHRELRVTQGHSFAFEQVLIPIGQLINGTTIRWDSNARYVEVFHVELDRHDIILAEGAPAESYRDDGNRTSFHSSDGKAGGAMPTCMPVVAFGPIVERTSRRLAERGERMLAINPRSSWAASS